MRHGPRRNHGSAGVRPDTLELMAWVSDPQVVVWKGDEDLPAKSRDIKKLRLIADHAILLDKIPVLDDLQSIGHSCCIVHQPEQHISSVFCDLKVQTNSLRCMVQDCGDVFAHCWTCHPTALPQPPTTCAHCCSSSWFASPQRRPQSCTQRFGPEGLTRYTIFT